MAVLLCTEFVYAATHMLNLTMVQHQQTDTEYNRARDAEGGNAQLPRNVHLRLAHWQARNADIIYFPAVHGSG